MCSIKKGVLDSGLRRRVPFTRDAAWQVAPVPGPVPGPPLVMPVVVPMQVPTAAAVCVCGGDEDAGLHAIMAALAIDGVHCRGAPLAAQGGAFQPTVM